MLFEIVRCMSLGVLFVARCLTYVDCCWLLLVGCRGCLMFVLFDG